MEVILKKAIFSLRFQILFVCILSLAIMQLLLVDNYFRYRTMKREENSQFFSDMISQMTNYVELNCRYLNGMVESIAYSEVIQNYLQLEEVRALPEDYKEVKTFIKPFININYDIKDVTIIDKNELVLNIAMNVEDALRISREIPENTLYYYTGFHSGYINNIMSNYLTVGAKVYSTSDFTQRESIGTVLISCNMRGIFGFSQYEKREESPDILIYDRNKNLIYSNVDSDIDTNFDSYFDEHGLEISETIKSNGQTFFIKTGVFPSLEGRVVFLITKAELMKGIEATEKRTFLLCIIVFIMILILSILVTNNIIVPIRRFMDYLIKVRRGDLRMIKKPIHLEGVSEIKMMADEFNQMMEEINDINHRLLRTSTRLYESELAKKQSELEYMYSQVNPHFLFNTLETIKGGAIEEDAKRTFKMIDSLGKMFRYCVRSGNIVSLEEEINVIHSYMLLQKIRYGQKLNFHCDIKKELYEAAIPKMILQPLIENAVIHGIEQNNTITVWLEGEVVDNLLHIYIRDDGIGIDDNRKKEIINTMNDNTKTNHIGISNVNKRIRFIYGDEYGLEIMTAPQGFGIMIKFPYEPFNHQN